MKMLAMRNKDYKVYVGYGEHGEVIYTIEDLSGKVLDYTESYQDAVQTCTYLQAMLDSDKYVAEVRCLKFQQIVDKTNAKKGDTEE